MVDNNAEIGSVVLCGEFPLDAGAPKSCRGTQAGLYRRSCKPATHAREAGQLWAIPEALESV